MALQVSCICYSFLLETLAPDFSQAPSHPSGLSLMAASSERPSVIFQRRLPLAPLAKGVYQCFPQRTPPSFHLLTDLCAGVLSPPVPARQGKTP